MHECEDDRKKLEAREKPAAFRVADRTIKPTTQAQARGGHSNGIVALAYKAIKFAAPTLAKHRDIVVAD